MAKLEENNWLEKETSAVEIATFDEISIDTHQLNKEPLCIHQDNTMGCYDRFIRSLATLNIHKFGILNNVCKRYIVTCDRMVFKL